MFEEEEPPAGPSLDSDDPKERIAARRLRIIERQEAQRRLDNISSDGSVAGSGEGVRGSNFEFIEP